MALEIDSAKKAQSLTVRARIVLRAARAGPSSMVPNCGKGFGAKGVTNRGFKAEGVCVLCPADEA
ncbi:MAG: hypothetical protein WAO35_25045 [Terriglobia bacterium]